MMKSLRRLHTSLALFVGLFLVLQGVSGAALLYRDAVEPIVHPTLQVANNGKAASEDALLNTVLTRYPDHIVKRVEFPRNPDRAIIFKLEDRNELPFLVAVDPYRKTVVGDGALTNWPFEWLLHWHEEMHSGALGETGIGIIGIALLVMAISGVAVWWPKGRLRDGFRLNGGKGRIKWVMRHRAIGAATSVVLILSASTGALMVFKDQLRDALEAIGPVAPKPSSKVSLKEDTPLLSLGTLRHRADTVGAGSQLRQLRFNGDNGQAVSFYYDAPPDTFGGITNFVSFDRYSGAEIGRYISAELPSNNNFVDYLYTLHTGAAVRGWLKLLLLIGAFALIFLPVSGALTWFNKPRRKVRSNEHE